MPVQLMAPSTGTAQVISDLSRTTGVMVYEVDGAIAGGEEIVFEIQGSDLAWRTLLQDTAEVKLTASNTIYATESKQRLRLNKTATVAAVGVKLSGWGL